MMEIRCEYCGSLIPDDATHCPNCGGVNANMRRAAEGTPKTIKELEEWYQARGLPPYNETRFFIGIDCREPKAFGIFKSGDKFIVYKNKSDGSRAIRYDGHDEDYAVNELYLKLKAEILNQREGQLEKGHVVHNIDNDNDGYNKPPPKEKKSLAEKLKTLSGIFGVLAGGGALLFAFFAAVSLLPPVVIGGGVVLIVLYIVLSRILEDYRKVIGWGCFIVFCLLLVGSIISNAVHRAPQYYESQDHTPYVLYDDSYYWYSSDGWLPVDDGDVPEDLTPVSGSDHYFNTDNGGDDSYHYSYNPGTYYSNSTGYDYDYSSGYDDDYTTSNDYDFTSSDYYTSWIDSIDFDTSYSYDNDYSWDTGISWDTGFSDWSSDW